MSADETDIEIVDAPTIQVKQEHVAATQSTGSAKQLIASAIVAIPEPCHTCSRNSRNSLVSMTSELLTNNLAFMKSIQQMTEQKLEFLERREACEKDEMALQSVREKREAAQAILKDENCDPEVHHAAKQFLLRQFLN